MKHDLPAFKLSVPDPVRTSVIFSSPHSGRYYPSDFKQNTALDLLRLRSSEDAFVDDFMRLAPDLGACSIAATYPRAYLDLNRAKDELDPGIIDGLRHRGSGSRVAAGLGVIPRVVSGGRAILRGKISVEEAQNRLDDIWEPWHGRIASLMEDVHAIFGEAILVDLHSMPSEAIEAFGLRRPEIVIGDRYGSSASERIVEGIEAAFAETGLSVSRNAPFAGAYIAKTYGQPNLGRHAVQIEINRALYMDEARIERRADFPEFQALMDGVLTRIADIGRPRQSGSLAAE
ncbi:MULTISPECIES: N-formylglutamate amidohydrolase [Thioclava]|uniref:N-formylglutamate amidohydrolase n=1 Tax=Thioclava litoralis TaxID=3076557 RepID=A0ABZ1E0U0_9RHOB|nr:N-formylglutamate amidohydrolase [Thioclava sp. FTW29]